MLFATLLSWKPGLNREQMDGAFMRRSQWKYPAGLKALGEYWTASPSPGVIFIFEASDYGPILEIGMTWGDIFDITTLPGVTVEEGLRIGPEILQRRPG